MPLEVKQAQYAQFEQKMFGTSRVIFLLILRVLSLLRPKLHI